MNALTRVAYDGPREGYKFPQSYRFYSPAGGIEASGCFKVIDTPAEGAGPCLERDVQRGFAEAQAAGLSNPVLVGVIPFDKQQPSSLFIPRHISHLPPTAPPTSICGFGCGNARQCIEQPNQAAAWTARISDTSARIRSPTAEAPRGGDRKRTMACWMQGSRLSFLLSTMNGCRPVLCSQLQGRQRWFKLLLLPRTTPPSRHSAENEDLAFGAVTDSWPLRKV